CTRLNANIKYMNSLEEIKDVTWLSISVDPVTDTIPVLAAYAERLNADPNQWVFARGELDYVKRIGNDFFNLPVIYKDHSDVAAVVDKNGRIAGLYNAVSTSDSKRMEKKLVELLAEPWTPSPAPEETTTEKETEEKTNELNNEAATEQATSE
ncbi:MAG: SCO family protein, partial [Lacipirellulaceae bacterium]